MVEEGGWAPQVWPASRPAAADGALPATTPAAGVLAAVRGLCPRLANWRDMKRTSAVPQEHLNAVVGYELHERGICAAQRKVARAEHRGTTYEQEVV